MFKSRIGIEFLENLARKGDARALNDLGMCYFETDNYKKALTWFRKAAKAGSRASLFNIGAIYERGLGVTQNYTKAAGYYEILAKKGDSEAQYDLARLYERGNGREQNYTKAARWYQKSAIQGNAWSQISLAHLYKLGLGVEKDYAQAYFWYSVAAIQSSYYLPLRRDFEKFLIKERMLPAKKRRKKGKGK